LNRRAEPKPATAFVIELARRAEARNSLRD